MTPPYGTDNGGGAAAPYKARKRRKLKLQAIKKQVAPGFVTRRPPRAPVKQVGGGVAAPPPLSTAQTTATIKPDRYQGLLPNGKTYKGRGRALGLRKAHRGRRRRRRGSFRALR